MEYHNFLLVKYLVDDAGAFSYKTIPEEHSYLEGRRVYQIREDSLSQHGTILSFQAFDITRRAPSSQVYYEGDDGETTMYVKAADFDASKNKYVLLDHKRVVGYLGHLDDLKTKPWPAGK